MFKKKNPKSYFNQFLIIFTLKGICLFICKNFKVLRQERFMPSLVELCLMLLQKKSKMLNVYNRQTNAGQKVIRKATASALDDEIINKMGET